MPLEIFKKEKEIRGRGYKKFKVWITVTEYKMHMTLDHHLMIVNVILATYSGLTKRGGMNW